MTSGPEDGDGARRAMAAPCGRPASSPPTSSISMPIRPRRRSATVPSSKRSKRCSAATEIAVSATKSATGHLLGAAGGLEAIFTVLALRDQIAPPTLNLETPDPAAEGVDLVAREARPMAMDHAISNGFGFGGVNASVIFRRWQ